MKTLIAGTFDNFHVGHQWLIWSAINKGGKVSVIVARDKTVKRIKSKSPKNKEALRLARVQIEIENTVSAQARLGRSDADFWQTIREENPTHILLGYDQHVQAADILKVFPDLIIERCNAYLPAVFKSSKF